MTPILHPIVSNPLLIAVIVLVVVLAVAIRVVNAPKPWHSRIRPKPLLTPNEVEFFHRLERALPNYHVFPQVAFGAILDVDGKKDSFPIRNRFSQKIADFVVCERDTLAVVALVELDDRTHDADRDRDRDEITKAAGYQTIRFPSRRKPTVAEIAALVQQTRVG
jgi:hypothetical protein